MELCLLNNSSIEVSDFQKDFMAKELEKINKECPIKEGDFDFIEVYKNKNDEGIEVFTYIRNNTKNSLKFEGVPFHLVYNNIPIAIVCPNMKTIGEVPPKSAVPFNIQFNKENIYYPELLDQSKMRVGVQLTAEPTIDVNIENLPSNLNYDQRKYIKDFVAKLDNVREGEYDISIVSTAKGFNGDLEIILLVRNGMETIIRVEQLNMTVYNSIDLMIYIGQCETNILLKEKSAGIYNLNLPKEKLPVLKEEDYSKFRIELK